MEQTLATRLTIKMNKYISRSGVDIFRNEELTQRKREILVAARDCLLELEKINLGNDTTQINTIIQTAIAAAGEVRASMAYPKEGEFEDLLRRFTLSVSNYTHLTPIEQKKHDEARSIA